MKGLQVLPIQQTIEDIRQILPYKEVVKVMDGVDTICNCCRDYCISPLDYLGRDSETKAIMMYVEGFREARHFLKVAREVTKKKPVIILKGGRTEAGVRILPHVIFFLTMYPSSTMYASGAGRGQPIYPLAKTPLA